MKRPLSLTGYVVGIVAAIYSFVLNLCIGIGLANILEESEMKLSNCDPTFQALYVFIWLIMAFSILSVILNISCVSDTSKRPSLFRKYYPFFIIAIVFNLLTSLLYVVTMVLLTVNVASIGIGSGAVSFEGYLLPFIALLTTSVLLIIDLVQESERREDDEENDENDEEEFEQYAELLKRKQEKVIKDKVANENKIKSDRLNEELVKLLEMKENELLSEEDYNLLKRNLLEKYMK